MSSLPNQVALRGLPFDVLYLALQLLPQADLRNAATASRAFRQAAKQAGLHIHRSVCWGIDDANVASQTVTFVRVLEHAKATNGRLSFALSFKGCIPNTNRQKSDLYESRHILFAKLSSAISQALPYLISLRLALPDYFRKDMDPLLCRPAPHLRNLEIQDFGRQGILRAAPLIPLPRDIFARDAPKLRSVTLSYVPLPSDPLPAFSRVTHAHLDFEDTFPDIDVPLHFPVLDSLHIEYLRGALAVRAPGCILRGLTLSSLTIDTDDRKDMIPLIFDQLDLTRIPAVHFIQEADDDRAWDATLRPDDRAELDVSISGPGPATEDADAEDVDVIITLPRAGWRRAFHVRGWRPAAPRALLGGGTGVVSLCLQNTFISGLLESGAAFPALRALRIELRSTAMIWPLAVWWDAVPGSDSDSDYGEDSVWPIYTVPCPRLETLSIVARGTPMMVETREVLELARALGQSGRRATQRARLVLRGVTLKGCISLAAVFSSVVS